MEDNFKETSLFFVYFFYYLWNVQSKRNFLDLIVNSNNQLKTHSVYRIHSASALSTQVSGGHSSELDFKEGVHPATLAPSLKRKKNQVHFLIPEALLNKRKPDEAKQF